MFFRRLRGADPVTHDPVLQNYRFTNVYRASDRVSQYLIRDIIPASTSDTVDRFFRILLFKFFNRITTWERLRERVGEPHPENYDAVRYGAVLDEMMSAGERVYASAYIMPAPPFGYVRKHANHLQLLKTMLADGLPERVAAAPSLQSVYEALLAYPSVGPFLAFQFAIDLNYSTLTNFEESEFVVAGPGARDGIGKCFEDPAGASEADIITAMAESAPDEFARLGLEFIPLWGRMPQLIDYQNVFCEVGKYARHAHPGVRGTSDRTRIKQVYRRNGAPLVPAYPAKWLLRAPVAGVPNPFAAA